jgi:hypothetical protein
VILHRALLDMDAAVHNALRINRHGSISQGPGMVHQWLCCGIPNRVRYFEAIKHGLLGLFTLCSRKGIETRDYVAFHILDFFNNTVFLHLYLS